MEIKRNSSQIFLKITKIKLNFVCEIFFFKKKKDKYFVNSVD